MAVQNFVCSPDSFGAETRFHPVTILLCEVEEQRDFSTPIASRACRVFGPVSRHRIIIRVM